MKKKVVALCRSVIILERRCLSFTVFKGIWQVLSRRSVRLRRIGTLGEGQRDGGEAVGINEKCEKSE